MPKNQLHKILCFGIALLFFSTASFSQEAPEETDVVEEDLPESPEQTEAPQAPEAKVKSKGSFSLINIANNGLATILTGGGKVTSLMFSAEENTNIDNAVEALKNNQTYTPAEKAKDPNSPDSQKDSEKVIKEYENEKSYIFLSSVMYFTASDWVVWINDQKITPETNKRDKELYLKSVQRDEVSVVWSMNATKWKILADRKMEDSTPQINADNKIQTSFSLKPNQTFILGLNKVVEGRALTALLRKKQEEDQETKRTSGGKTAAPNSTPSSGRTFKALPESIGGRKN